MKYNAEQLSKRVYNCS